MSFSKKILDYLKLNNFINYNDFETFVKNLGHKISYGEREMRRLHEEDKIEKKLNSKGFIVGYQIKDERPPENKKEEVNNKLRDLLVETASGDYWFGSEKVAEINKALKTDNIYYKESILRKYKK